MSSTGSFQILKAKQEFFFKTPFISRATSASDLEKKWQDIEHVLAQFNQFTGCIAAEVDVKTDPGGTKADAVQALINSAKQEIVCSALKPEMLTLYSGTLFNPRMPVSTIQSNLKQVLGEISPKEAKKQLKANFLKLTRRCDINEKFETFLNRLIFESTSLSNNQDVRDELVIEQFESSLRPMDLEAIEVFYEDEDTGIDLVKAQAELLDRKKFFKRSEVESNHLELQQANTILIDQVDNLTRKITSFESSAENREQVLTNKIMELQSQMNQLVNSIQSGTSQTVHSTTSTAPPKPNPAKSSNSGNGKSKKDGQFQNRFKDPDYFCYNCGLHRCSNKHKCDGDDTKFCVICQKNGHVASSRKYHKPAGSPKKSKNE